jgi:hypothetical protein
MTHRVAVRCNGCNARLSVSPRFIGRTAPCPKCSQPLTVRPHVPDDEAPVLVADDERMPAPPRPDWLP